MRGYFTGLVLVACSNFTNVAVADDAMSPIPAAPASKAPISLQLPDNANPVTYYKGMLFDYLNAGGIEAGTFDKQTEINIAQTQLELAKAYMQQGDRRLALVLGVSARKTMQRAIGNPQDPAMIPIYTILVQLYTSKVDIDNPETDQSDANKAKEYRELIDRIHAQ